MGKAKGGFSGGTAASGINIVAGGWVAGQQAPALSVLTLHLLPIERRLAE